MVRTSRRQALGLIAAFAASSVLPAAAQTTAFPSRPIRLIVPQALGGNSDTFGRILAQKLSDRLGQQVVVENRPGAGGTVGSALVSKAAPDGYTLLVADNGTHAIAPTRRSPPGTPRSSSRWRRASRASSPIRRPGRATART